MLSGPFVDVSSSSADLIIFLLLLLYFFLSKSWGFGAFMLFVLNLVLVLCWWLAETTGVDTITESKLLVLWWWCWCWLLLWWDDELVDADEEADEEMDAINEDDEESELDVDDEYWLSDKLDE